MFDLMVSYDCGCNYGLDKSAMTLDELKPRMAELDAEGLRWVVEKDGEMVDEVMCGIHAGIFSTMIAIRARDQIGEIKARTVKPDSG